ncbi:MAG: Na+/H+ antiporter NhaA [Bdellovibrionales bacterium]|nr:Na+/H+ antiporter NhaA [Bdellovibrionales bacterium]
MSQHESDIHHKRQPKKIPNRVVNRIITPIESFFAMETASGVLLMITTIFALIWANSPYYHYYEMMVDLPVGVKLGGIEIIKSLHHWVNDGIMVIFFFVVGLEIKRELIVGELSSPKKAALPMFAAVGGMVIPALIYASLNHDGIGKTGWGIPMATDIAFAVGILTLMNRKVPMALKVFLLALAIVDDLGAVLVIALFYTSEIVGSALAIAAAGIFATLFMKYAGIRKFLIYWVLGIIVWFAVLKSGVHATVAGVILGLMTPVAPFYNLKRIPEKFRQLVDRINGGIDQANKEYTKLDDVTFHSLEELEEVVIESRSPLDRLIHLLHPWVSYVIMPLFALFNAGVHISGDFSLDIFLSQPIALGVIFGLFIGKPVGVLLASWIAIKLKMAQLPTGVTWYHMVAVGCLAGIGFTMALFVGHLALKVPEVEIYSKLGILVASLFSGVVGVVLLAFCKDVKQVS